MVRELAQWAMVWGYDSLRPTHLAGTLVVGHTSLLLQETMAHDKKPPPTSNRNHIIDNHIVDTWK